MTFGGKLFNRSEVASKICEALEVNRENLSRMYVANDPINFFYLDNLLPEEFVKSIYASFPSKEKMRLRRTLREVKYVSAQMDSHASLLEEVVYAFQDSRVVSKISKITGIENLMPDNRLYAGGISMMGKGHFLNPHLDNSHDAHRKNYRVLNLLYYVSPDWELKNGGNLELWPEGPSQKGITLESKENRLVVMVTNSRSWHSVSPVKVEACRCCISNYYFSEKSVEDRDYFHVTTFRGRPEQKVKNLALMADSALRMIIRSFFPRGLFKISHIYNRSIEKR